jgi:hypothetical protein
MSVGHRHTIYTILSATTFTMLLWQAQVMAESSCRMITNIMMVIRER